MTRATIVFHRPYFVFFLFLVAFAALGLSACESGGGKSVSTESIAKPADKTVAKAPDNLAPVKVALLVPLSGRNAALGQSLLNAAQIALFDIGHPNFELMPRDTKGTSDGAGKAAAEAIEEGAQLILGPVFTDEVRGAKPAAHNSGVNMITFSTNWELADDNTYIMGFLPFDQIERITGFAAGQNIKRIGVIAPANDYGRTVISSYQLMASRLGILTPQAITIQPDSPTAANAVRAFAQGNTGLEAVFMPLGGDNAAMVSGLLNDNGLPAAQIRRIGTGLFDDAALATRPEMEGAWFAASAPAQRAGFEQRFLQTYNYPPPRLSTLAYDATALASVLAQRGLQARGAPAFDRASITNANGFAGLDGIFRFRQNGMAERGLAVLEIRSGKIVVIDPARTTFQ